MIKAVIIDDEPHVAQGLSALLEAFCPDVQISDMAHSVTDGLTLILKEKPELVFLDIHIGDETGFELLEKLGKFDFQLIFTTGHSDYAIKAFRYHAIDYLLKPIEPGLLVEAVEKVKKHQSAIDRQQLAHFFQSMSTQKLDKITVATSEGYHLIEIQDIVRLAGEGNYSTFHLRNGEQIVASKSLKTFEELLPAKQFMKVHQSHIVNLDCVKKVLFQDGNFLQLQDGAQVPMARRRKDAVLEALKIR